MDALRQITKESWHSDLTFLLAGVLRGGTEEIQQARLEEYLEARYSYDLVPIAFRSLKYSYNFIARNWDCLHEVGIIHTDKSGRIGVTNALVFALFDSALATPSPEQIVNVDPLKVVRIAQRYIEQEKTS
jgi:hypothetical protein